MRAVVAGIVVVVSLGCGGRTPLLPGSPQEAAIDGGMGGAGPGHPDAAGLPETGPTRDAGSGSGGPFDAHVAACVPGPPVVLASGQTPTAIAVAGDRVFWSNSNGLPCAMGVAKSGGPILDYGSGPGDCWGVTADTVDVFWTDRAGKLRSEPVGGGAPTVLAGGGFGDGMTMDASYVYWADNGSHVRRIPRTGGAVQVLVSDAQEAVDVAVDADHVYWTEWQAGGISRAPLAGGATEIVATGTQSAYQVAVGGDYVYWTAQGSPGHGVFRAPKTGGSATFLAGTGSLPNGIAVDSEFVYWTDLGADTTGGVNKTPLAGGATIAIATDEPYVRDVALDDDCVYWVEDSGDVRVTHK